MEKPSGLSDGVCGARETIEGLSEPAVRGQASPLGLVAVETAGRSVSFIRLLVPHWRLPRRFSSNRYSDTDCPRSLRGCAPLSDRALARRVQRPSSKSRACNSRTVRPRILQKLAESDASGRLLPIPQPCESRVLALQPQAQDSSKSVRRR